MYYIAIGIVMFLMIVVQATVFSVFFPMITLSDSFAVPNIMIIVLILVSILRDDKNIIFVAFIVGFLQDIVFGSYIGLYAFTYAFIAYWANVTFCLFVDRHVIIFLTSVVLALFSFELLVWGINSLFGLIDVPFQQAFDRYFWGSILLGSAIAVIIYRPTVSFLERRGMMFYE